MTDAGPDDEWVQLQGHPGQDHLGQSSSLISTGCRTALTLHEQARMTGAYLWIEQQLFEMLGFWVADESNARARLLFDAHSARHAWHAELFAGRLPLVEGIDLDSLTVAQGSGARRLFEVASRTETTLSRLSTLTRVVLPRLITGYRLHLRRAAPVADAPLARALGLALRDELDAWQESECLFEDLARHLGDSSVDEDRSEALYRHTADLDRALAAEFPGLVSWPSPGSG